MSRSLRRGAIAALVLSIAPLSACAAGGDTATSLVKPDNAATSIGNNLKLNNILVITAPGTGATETASGPAAVSVNISNTGTTAEVLKSVTVADAGTATITGPQGHSAQSITIPAGGSVLLGGPGQPSAQVASATVQLGGYSNVTFAFDSAGTVTAPGTVVTGSGEYASFAPSAPQPAASAVLPANSTGGSATPAGSVSGSSTATPADTAGDSSVGTPANTTSGTPQG